MISKKEQKSGDYSVQFQIDTLKIEVSEEKIRLIIKDEIQKAINEYKLVASDTAERRLDNYTTILIPKLVKAELLDAFTDPSFQYLFRDSEKTAVCTERESDYEMLSELLIHRSKHKNNYTITAAIQKAIHEVNNVSDEALMVLTLLHSIISFEPVSDSVSNGLKLMNDLYKKIIEGRKLPNTIDWIENLEVINSIRTNSIVGSLKLEDYLCNKLKNYTQCGIKKDSDKYKEIIDMFKNENIPLDLLCENELDTSYVRLLFPSKRDLKDSFELNGKIYQLNPNQIKIVEGVFDLYTSDTELTNNQLKNKLFEFDTICEIAKWWNVSLEKISLQITPVGSVLANTNVRRIDDSVPDIVNK